MEDEKKNSGYESKNHAFMKLFMSYQITLFFLFSLGFLGLVIRIEIFHFNLKKKKTTSTC